MPNFNISARTQTADNLLSLGDGVTIHGAHASKLPATVEHISNNGTTIIIREDHVVKDSSPLAFARNDYGRVLTYTLRTVYIERDSDSEKRVTKTRYDQLDHAQREVLAVWCEKGFPASLLCLTVGRKYYIA